MQAIEFETVVEGGSIPLPEPSGLSSGQSVRVVVMFESAAEGGRSTSNGEALISLARNPLVIDDFAPLSRDNAHAR
jgi:hypothetical protein